MRAGLELAGWNCVLSIDNDQDAVSVHKLIHGDCNLEDVRRVEPDSLPEHDALVAGFPCQPFSTSGDRSGFSHDSGSVFDEIIRLAESLMPKFVILENVRGLLSNRNGHTMARVLSGLSSIGYFVSWSVIDAIWFGIPQSRPRVFIIATRSDRSPLVQDLFRRSLLQISLKTHPLLSKLATTRRIRLGRPSLGSLGEIIKQTERQIGKRVDTKTPFFHSGLAFEDQFVTCHATIAETLFVDEELGKIVSPQSPRRADIRSIRYWGHSGVTKPYVKEKPISHAIGTNIGASPLFGIPEEKIESIEDAEKLLEYSNWNRSQSGLRIWRIEAQRGALLFGRGSDSISDGLIRSSVSQTKQYVLLGNIVAPPVAEFVANCLDLTDVQR